MSVAPIAQPSFLASRRGRLTLGLVCLAGFLDFIDTTIVNVALPSIREHLHFSILSLQWIVSGYMLTYGGFLLLGGRAADLLGRRKLLVAGTALFGLSSLLGGLAGSEDVLIAARLAQGLGAAMMTPAALSILTTSFSEGPDRIKAIGIWGATIPVASAIGVLLGGVMSQGPGWRWVFFVNPPVCAVVILGAFRIMGPDERTAVSRKNFDAAGSFMAAGGMLLLVYALVRAPQVGWGAAGTIGELAGGCLLLAGFTFNELRHSNPVFPLSIFKVKGLAQADVTQVLAMAGFFSLYFFLTLYMQNVLGFSPIATGMAYLPVTVGVGMGSVIATRLMPRLGTRPLIVAGTLLGSAGIYLLSRIPADGSYAADLLPGLVVMAVGLGFVFVGVQTAANAGVPSEQAGMAAALITACQTIGSALGLAIFSAIATSHTNHLLATHFSPAQALTSGFQRALFACSMFLLAAAFVASRAPNSRPVETPAGEPSDSELTVPAPA